MISGGMGGMDLLMWAFVCRGWRDLILSAQHDGGGGLAAVLRQFQELAAALAGRLRGRAGPSARGPRSTSAFTPPPPAAGSERVCNGRSRAVDGPEGTAISACLLDNPSHPLHFRVGQLGPSRSAPPHPEGGRACSLRDADSACTTACLPACRRRVAYGFVCRSCTRFISTWPDWPPRIHVCPPVPPRAFTCA
jgi:hypothetical protein